ncbi:MAG: type I polyketide synthase [Aquisalinus sp.]|nr:type I polyketide synthase [Aquisalinus sp.]
MMDTDTPNAHEGIAIVGMSGRFPGAPDVEAFWQNIKESRESITMFDPAELEIPMPDQADTSEQGDYVCAKGMLDNIDMFDARFFGYLPKEAEVMDPQHRVFLEICSEAIEHAGYDAQRYDGAIGVYGGCYMDTYVLANLCSDEDFRQKLVESIQVGTLQTELGNDKDYLATRVAFKLGLRGPAMTLQTACSTSLVAVATACQSLDSYQCDMALAGGITIVLPQKKGYFYKEGSMLSPDGHCRPFDSNAAGTVFSNGAAVLLLKRLEDAILDRDTIYGVIKGYATNNDGGQKVSYTAPSVDGQAEVISMAMGLGEIEPHTMGYVEAHGTATPLGDPIEIAGLTKAYREGTDDVQFCAIGSVKANLGHLDCASGAIGLIKSTLCVHNKVLPSLLHFEAPNPKIDFESSPFYVNTEFRHWPENAWPRRAGVSSFGVGGTNAHVVIEEAPLLPQNQVTKPAFLMPFSAKSESAVRQQAAQLADYFEANDAVDLADVAFTLQQGRSVYDYRGSVAGSTQIDLCEKLRKFAAAGTAVKPEVRDPELVFMFPGQGAQYPGMGYELYQKEPAFRQVIDDVAEVLLQSESFDTDIRDYLLWRDGESRMSAEQATSDLAQTWLTQPAIFAVEIALARLLESYGVIPHSIIGHSVGEFAAACHAGLLSLEDATSLIAARGRLIHDLPGGQMLAVLQTREEVEKILPDTLSIAAVNAPGATVVSGNQDYIEAFAELLAKQDVKSTVLATSHAFHSNMMAEAVQPLMEKAAECTFQDEARFEIVSTLTGQKATFADFAEPAYWGRQLRQPVLFQEAVETAAKESTHCIFVEVGPGQALSSFVKRALQGDMKRSVYAAMGPARDPGSDYENILHLLGQLWANGTVPDWTKLEDGSPRRVALPTYPFERKRFWVEPKGAQITVAKDTPRISESAPAKEVPVSNEPTQQQAVASNDMEDEVETLIRQQLEVISGQLRILGGQ